MEINSYQPSFGMVKYGEGVADYVKTLGRYKAVEFRVIGIKNRENPIVVDLSLVKKFGRIRLKAEVGAKSYVENMFRNAICTLAKAVKKANEIYEHRLASSNELEKINVPDLLG